LDTPGRAQNALARATQQEEAGNLSPQAARQIRTKAYRRLGRRSKRR
jgi:hypothetical protein